jgi:putative ABC transport system substrate-binding protein
MGASMRRREFITALGSTAAWSIEVWAQQGNRIPRVSVILPGANRRYEAFFAALTKALLELGWTDGKNIQIDYHFAGMDGPRTGAVANEVVSLKPDVILAGGASIAAAVQRVTNNIPIVFVWVADPVAIKLVASLSRPGANITGFSRYEPPLAGKHVEILKEIIPGMTAVADMFSSTQHAVVDPWLKAAAQYHAVELISAPVSNDADIEHVISSLGDKRTIGLIVHGEAFFASRRDLIYSLTMRYHVVSISAFRYFVDAGGLISYGDDLVEQFRQAAGYIDRILKGTSPADLPVQLPAKYEMVINLKTATAMGITIPPALLARADEIIE